MRAEFTDNNGYLRWTDTMETKIKPGIGQNIQIIYDRYKPGRADIAHNKLTGDGLFFYWLGSFIFIGFIIRYYRESHQQA